MTDRARAKTYSYRHDAELAMSLLDAAGIKAYITADDAGGQAVGIQLLGGVDLWVPASDLEQARALLSDADRPPAEAAPADLAELGIRPLGSRDAEDCFRMRAEAIIRVLADELDRRAVSATINAYMPSGFERMAQSMPAFGAVHDERLIGFCILRLLDPRTAEVFLIYVNLPCVGRGIGSRLIEHAERWLLENRPETTWLVVDTISPNYNRGFYESCGFAPVGDRLSQYPGCAIPALRLRKALSRQRIHLPDAT